ncbi:hypothetical protein ACVPOQ_14045 [Staphylococcus aureus]
MAALLNATKNTDTYNVACYYAYIIP